MFVFSCCKHNCDCFFLNGRIRKIVSGFCFKDCIYGIRFFTAPAVCFGKKRKDGAVLWGKFVCVFQSLYCAVEVVLAQENSSLKGVQFCVFRMKFDCVADKVCGSARFSVRKQHFGVVLYGVSPARFCPERRFECSYCACIVVNCLIRFCKVVLQNRMVRVNLKSFFVCGNCFCVVMLFCID